MHVTAKPTTLSSAPRRAGPMLVAALVAVFVVVLVRTAWVCDDAFITLRSVEALVEGRGLVWNPGQRVQVFGAGQPVDR